MVHSPSKVWVDGVLVDRCIATNEPGEPVEDPDFVSGTKPYKTPEPTPRRDQKKVDAKSTENKTVKKADSK